MRTKMIRIGFSLLLILIITTSCKAQKYKIGIWGGTSYYLGDVNPNIHFKDNYIPALGVFFKKVLNKRYALRFGAYYGQLNASDEATALPFNIFRNYSFHSNLYDFSGNLEFNFLPYATGMSSHPFTPYVFIGPSLFYSTISSKGYFLDRNPYSSNSNLFSFAVNFGAGLKFRLSNHLNFALEWGMRKTYTDDLDGLPNIYENKLQEANPKNKDWYNLSGIMLSYKFISKRNKCPHVN